MVARGFASETFCYEAIAARQGDDRPYHVYYLGDFDRAGQDAARSLEEKLIRFGDEDGIEVIFEQIAVAFEQINDGTSRRDHQSVFHRLIEIGLTTSRASWTRYLPIPCAISLRRQSIDTSIKIN